MTTILAAGALAGLLPLLLVLACPLAMLFMMRGMHGGGHGHGHADRSRPRDGEQQEVADARPSRTTMSLDELKRERDELNALIGERAEEAVEANR